MLSFYGKSANEDMPFPVSTTLSLLELSKENKCILWVYGSRCDHCRQLCSYWNRACANNPYNVSMEAFDAQGDDKHNIVKEVNLTQVPAFLVVHNGNILKTEVGLQTYEEIQSLQQESLVLIAKR